MANPSTPSSHRPRKKRNVFTTSPTSNNDLVQDPSSSHPSPAFPLVSFLWGARAGVSQWLILPLILMTVGLFRWAVSLWGYSGFQAPPMYGDFEAQRHWMELTIHLPTSMWYLYDLQYWGLDYPPLTAYHSWLLGKVGSLFDPAWFALDNSRGFEDPSLKVYMRATVVVSEYLVYIPAVVIFLRRYSRMQGVHAWSASTALVAVLMQPSTILIDHGHFQYNTVMLGLMVASLSSILAGRSLWACIFFVGALTFKQMALYYAPIMFCFLLGSCIFPRIRIVRLISIAVVTLATFLIIFAPLIAGALYDKHRGIPIAAPVPSFLRSLDEDSWIYPPLFQLAQAVHRIFPFARGLFEDKVANAWCAVHTFYKLNRFPTTVLQKVSLGATLASIFIPCVIILRHPRPSLLLPALSSCAWGFFLFSFQVHEKSVLLPLLPMTLLLGGEGGLSKETRAWVGWANCLGAWTMFPLLKREQLRIPYFVITLLWAYLLGLPPTSLDIFRNHPQTNAATPRANLHIITKLLHFSFYSAMIAWHILEAFVAPPPEKPDLWVVLNVLIGAGGFGIAYLWCTWKLIAQSSKLSPKASDEEIKKKRQ